MAVLDQHPTKGHLLKPSYKGTPAEAVDICKLFSAREQHSNATVSNGCNMRLMQMYAVVLWARTESSNRVLHLGPQLIPAR